MKFKKVNLNPKFKNTKDCAVRALAAAFGISWHEALMELARTSESTCYMPNARPNVIECIKSHGWIQKNGKRKKLKDMHFKGTHIVHLSQKGKYHLTYVEDGVLIDTWNCENWRIDYYYNKPN